MSAVYEVKTKDYVVGIHYDSSSESPREWSSFGKMICWHRRYSLGDKHSFRTPSEFHEEVKDSNAVILPVYMLDHSGITIATSPFGCPWDSGQLGHIYVTHEDVIKEYGELTEETIEKAKSVLEGEVKLYDMYVRGEVFGYTIERKIYNEKTNDIDLDIIDSCWGFLGEIEHSGILDEIASYDKELGKLMAIEVGIEVSA